MAVLKPFVINLSDLAYLLKQVNFIPLFDAEGNALVAFDPATTTRDVYSANNVKLWDANSGALTAEANSLGFDTVAQLGSGFPQVSAPIGIREVSGFHNNLFGTQAQWGNADVPFVRQVAADFTNYVTSPGADYTTVVDGNGVHQSNVVDAMPRLISRTITTAGVNLLKDGGHYVEWSSDRYANEPAYKALIDGAGVNTAVLVEGAKIVAPLGLSLIWDEATYNASAVYKYGLTMLALSAFGSDGKLYGSATGGALVDGGDIYLKINGSYVQQPLKFSAELLVYHDLADSSGANLGALANADLITLTPGQVAAAATAMTTFGTVLGTLDAAAIDAFVTSDTGYGLLAQLGHIDFQNPDSGEYFVGSENPGVAPVNSWFGIFGQFFDHGLDFIDKGGQGTKITIALDPSDPLYGAIGPDGRPVTSIVVARATVAGADANGDPNFVNHTSPFIDQSQTYGSNDQVTSILRKWVSTDGDQTFHAGMSLLDGETLQSAWTRKVPVFNPATGLTEIVETPVHDTLPTLNELRTHLAATNRDDLTWEDVNNLRNRDASGDVIADGQPGAGNSGHALLLDMNPHFDQATLLKGDGAHDAQLLSAIALLDADVKAIYSPTAALSFNANGVLQLDGVGPTPLVGASALFPWVNFANFSIMQTHGMATSEALSDAVKAAVGEVLMASVGDHYLAGDGRVNENFGLTSIHHVFHEEHNYQVENLKSWIYAHDLNNPGATDAHEKLHEWQIVTGEMDAQGNYTYADGSIAWDPDKMFNATKLIVEMEYQHAAVDQYARTVTPRIQEFVGYSTGVDATISLEYAQVAFRFGHSTIRETIDTLDPSGWYKGAVMRYALEKAFLAPQTFAEEGVAAITLGLTRQQMNEVDEFVTPALNQGLLGQPLDLAAINLARGRDIGVPTLNDFRDGIGLARYTSWADFGSNMIHPESLVNFIAAYSFGGDVAKATAILGLVDGSINEGSIAAQGFTFAQAIAILNNDTSSLTGADLGYADGFNHIDSWIGGLAEAHVPGGLLGETFDAVFVAQIQALMDGDRFYYLYRLFGTQIHEEINNGQFKDIVERNTGLVHLNGSIFAYADKYYDFGLNSGQSKQGVQDDFANHVYVNKIEAEQKGIFSDGGSDTSHNGDIVTLDGVSYIRDVRVNAQPDLVHPVEGTPTDGADSHEVLVGTQFADYIHARAGDDTVYGDGGQDVIFGDGGVDRLYGGDGDDYIDTGEGPDLADGGAGKDQIYGRGSGSEVGGFDQLVGGSGNDLIVGGEGIDKLSGGSGDDIIYGDGLTNPEMGNTDPFTHAGDGNDYIDGGASGDNLYGEEGDDLILGGNDQDIIYGGSGDDILRPGNASQAINGGPDEVLGDDGFVNNGYDLIDYSDRVQSAAGGLTIDFAAQNNPVQAIDGTTPHAAWAQIEGAVGTRNDDSIIGDSAGDATATFSNGDNWLIGGSGDDALQGNGGNDLLVGGSIRLDALIGQYADAANASGSQNLVIGSAEWIADAMRTGSGGYSTATGPDGYDNDTENPYTGSSNLATGSLGDGLLANAALGTEMFDKHFTEMLKSRMFKDLVLGDGRPDGTADTAVFTGNRADYTVEKILYTPAGASTAITAFKITDNGYTPVDVNDPIPARAPTDGTDLVVGVERFQFADGTLVGETALLNMPPVIDTANALAFAVAENTAAGTPLATILAHDLNATDVLAFSIAGGVEAAPGQPLLAIDAQSGAVTLSAVPDFEALALLPDVTVAANGLSLTFTATVSVSDGTSTASRPYTFQIDNINEPGSYTVHMLGGSVAGNTVTLNGSVVASDPDGVLATTYAWSNGAATQDATVNASNQQQTITLSGGYTDPFGTASAAAPETAIVDRAGRDSTLNGSNGANLMFGLSGDDTLNGSGGNDVLDGGTGNDALNGGNGTDTAVFTGTAAEHVFTLSSSGLGVSSAADGSDALSSIEQLRFGAVDYGVVTGSSNINTLNASDVAEVILGGGGNDTINAGGGDDVIAWAATGNNNVTTDGRDIVDGGAGNDTFVVSSTVSGNQRNETFNIYTKADWLALGGNNHTLANQDTEIVITRNGSTNTSVIAELRNVEELVINTGPGTDTVTPSGNFDTTHLNYNTITINDADGGDTVDITGLTSDHRIVFNTDANGHVVGDTRPQDIVNQNGTGSEDGDTEDAGSNSDTEAEHTGDVGGHVITDDGVSPAVMGSGERDVISVTSAHVISAGAGDDIVTTGDGVVVDAGDGDDIVTTGDGSNVVLGGDGNDIIETGAGNDKVFGEDGDDLIDTGAGNDMVWGGAGNDEIHAGAGDDRIEGGSGADLLWGGAGNDVFVFRTISDADGDSVADFAAGDRIDLTFMDANEAVDGNNAFHLADGPQFTGAGELIVTYDANNDQTTVAGNTDGDAATAEFTIVVSGDHLNDLKQGGLGL